ncbi:MAG: hypothetical protein R3D98_15595 [Candidatus Krumholzibacteriia bacterium]
MRSRSATLGVVLLMVSLAPAAARGYPLWVPGQYSSIALALDHAAAGDTVMVTQGTYYESNLVIPAGVHLSGYSPSPELTVIDAQQHGRVLTITGGDTQVRDLRLTGGWSVRGGGIHVDAGSISLQNIVIDDCFASSGGGVYVDGATVAMDRCYLLDNEASTSGGGLQLVGEAQATLTGCLLHANRAGALGGAWYAARSALVVESSTLEGNQAPLGADGTAFGSEPVVFAGSLTVDNRPQLGYAGLASVLFSDLPSHVQHSCSLRWQPGDDVWTGYLAAQLAAGGLGNLDANPIFCRDDGGWESYFGLAANSPALGLGDPCGLRGAFGQACDAVDAPEVPALVDRLFPAYPNPFNPSTTIQFDVAKAGPVQLVIYGLDGRRVTTLIHDPLDAGRHHAQWLGRDDGGRSVASGIYVARLITPRAATPFA